MTRTRTFPAALMLLPLAGWPGAPIHSEARERHAQGSVTIPTDAQLERLQREAITTPPLSVSGAPPRGGEGARAGSAERHDRRIERKPPKRGGACDDC